MNSRTKLVLSALCSIFLTTNSFAEDRRLAGLFIEVGRCQDREQTHLVSVPEMEHLDRTKGNALAGISINVTHNDHGGHKNVAFVGGNAVQLTLFVRGGGTYQGILGCVDGFEASYSVDVIGHYKTP